MSSGEIQTPEVATLPQGVERHWDDRGIYYRISGMAVGFNFPSMEFRWFGCNGATIDNAREFHKVLGIVIAEAEQMRNTQGGPSAPNPADKKENENEVKSNVL